MIPFNEYDLSRILPLRTAQMKEHIEKFTNDEIASNNLELLADLCYEEFHIEPVVIFEEDLRRRQSEQVKINKQSRLNSDRTIKVDGVLLKFYFPFTGDELLFKCKASTFTCGAYPNMEIVNNYLIFSIQNELQMIDDNTKEIFNLIKKNLSDIKQGIEFANRDVEDFNDKLRQNALASLEGRRKQIEKFYSLNKLLEIPMQKSDFAVSHIPMKKKIISITSKPNHEKSYQIKDEEYNVILDIIRHNGSTYERTPCSYKSMNEENLRDILLAALNGMYKGGANGETFRNKGKTDICIEAENRAAFIAECKMWKGQKQVEEAIDQLDSYLTWRDCKNALIYFVRNKNFIGVTENMKTALVNYHLYRQINILGQNEFDLIYYSNNPGQLVKVRVILFNLYCTE